MDGLDKRSLGNRATDLFGSCYRTKLPLPEMRAISGHDTRRGYFLLPRSSLFGYESHTYLPLQIFPWLEDPMKTPNKEGKPTTISLLSLL